MARWFTFGGYANGSDFSQFNRNGGFGGIVVDCNMLAQEGIVIAFGQLTNLSNLEVKNCLTADYQAGVVGAPLVQTAVYADRIKTTRDIFNVPISNITATNPAVATTTIDHGIATGRIVGIYHSTSNIPTGTVPIAMWAESTGPRTLVLHGFNATGIGTYTGTDYINLTFPTNSIIHQVYAMTAGNPATISVTPGDYNFANGKTICLYFMGGTGGTPSNTPDGCYTMTVTATGGDGPYQFTIPFNSTGSSFASPGIAFLQNPLGDIGFYGANQSDTEIEHVDFSGTRWPIYIPQGYAGKYVGNHVWADLAGQGYVISGTVLGGRNTVVGQQCDQPFVFCLQYVANGVLNVATGVSSTELYDSNQSWSYADTYNGDKSLFRLDAGASLMDFGPILHGSTSTSKISELSAASIAGTPGTFTCPSNYSRYGFGPTPYASDYVLYTLPNC